MDARVFIEPQQGTTYTEVVALARRAEELGFEGFFTSDHYVKMGDHDSGLPGPLDSWTTLAGLARDTERLRLGTLVSPITFRHPGQLAITGLWATPEGDHFSYAGEYFTLVDSPALPKPWQRPAPPIIIGGRGKRRTPSLAATHAREFNVPFADVEDWKATCIPVVEACESRERDPETLVWSAAQVVAIGSTEAEFARRAEAIGRETAELRQNGIAGVLDEALDRVAAFAEAGCSRMYYQVLDVKDLDHLATLAEVLGLQA